MDVHSLETFNGREEAATYKKNLLGGFWSAEEYYGFLNTFKYEEQKVTLDKYTIIEESRTRTVYNWLQHFNPEMLKQEFQECGLDIRDIYSDVAGAAFDPKSGDFAVIAGKG